MAKAEKRASAGRAAVKVGKTREAAKVTQGKTKQLSPVTRATGAKPVSAAKSSGKTVARVESPAKVSGKTVSVAKAPVAAKTPVAAKPTAPAKAPVAAKPTAPAKAPVVPAKTPVVAAKIPAGKPAVSAKVVAPPAAKAPSASPAKAAPSVAKTAPATPAGRLQTISSLPPLAIPRPKAPGAQAGKVQKPFGGVPVAGKTNGFSGRKGERERLVSLLSERPLAFVVGPTGSGKTAFALAALADRGTTQVRVVVVGDDERPSVLLARLISGPDRDQPLDERALQALDERSETVVLRDLHKLRDQAKVAQFLRDFQQRAKTAKLVVTATATHASWPAQSATVTLGALSKDDAKALWTAMSTQLGTSQYTLDQAQSVAKGSFAKLRVLFAAGLFAPGGGKADNRAKGKNKEAAPPRALPKTLIDDLPKDALQVLEWLKVAGRPVAEDFLAVGLPAPRLDIALRALGARLLVERSQEGHVGAAAVVLEQLKLPDARKQQASRSLAGSFTRFLDERTGAESRGETVLALAEAVRFYLEAGDKIKATAVLAANGGAMPSPILGELLLELAALKQRTPELKALAQRLVSRTRDLELAYRVLQGTVDPAPLEQRFLLGKQAFLVGDLAEAERLLAVCEKPNTHGIPGRRPALIALGCVRAEQGNIELALSLIEAQKGAIVDSEVVSWIRVGVADCCERPEEIRRILAAEISRRGETRDLEALTLGLTMAVAEAEAGAAAHAMMRIGDLERLSQLIHDPYGDLQLRLARGIVDVARGATQIGAQALHSIDSDPRLSFLDRLRAKSAFAQALRDLGKPAEARKRAEEAIAIAEQHGYRVRALRLGWVLASIELAAGRFSQALKLASDIRIQVQKNFEDKLPRLLADALLIEAEAKALLGDHRGARKSLDDAMSKLEVAGQPTQTQTITLAPRGAQQVPASLAAGKLSVARVIAICEGPAAAHSPAQIAADSLARVGRAQGAAEAELMLVAAALADGQLVEAQTKLDGARGRELGKWPKLAFEGAMLEAALAEARGDTPRSKAALAESEARAPAVGSPVAIEAVAVAQAVRAEGEVKAVKPSVAAQALLRRLAFEEPRTYLYVTAVGRKPVGRSVELPQDLEVVIDGRDDAIIGPGGKRATLDPKDKLRVALYLFALFEGRVLTADDIVERVWGAAYEPERHDVPISGAIAKLRALFKKATGELAAIDDVGGGFRLTVNGSYAFVVPRTM